MNDYVQALAVGLDGSLYAAGEFTAAGGIAANRVARWDGSSWHPLGDGLTNVGWGSISALAIGPDGSLYVGGDFTTAGGQPVNYVARWDGAAWHPLGDGMGGSGSPYVEALVVGPDGSLYAGGRFITAGGTPANHIARWDGTRWHPLGGGMDGLTTQALAFGPSGALYAGGYFGTTGGVTATNIARWDGTAWHPLGSGVNRPVFALAFGADSSLYAGGQFTIAGGIPSNYIARWTGEALLNKVIWLPLVLR